MTAAGLLTLIWSIYAVRGTIDWTRAAGSLAMLAIICGVVMGGVALLALKGRSIEEAYTLGYDVGYEKGYRAGQRHLLAACPLPTQACVLKSADLDDPESLESIVTFLDDEREG